MPIRTAIIKKWGAHLGWMLALSLLSVPLPELLLRRSETPQIVGLYSLRYAGFLGAYLLLVLALLATAAFAFRRNSDSGSRLARAWKKGFPLLAAVTLILAWIAWAILQGSFLRSIETKASLVMGPALAAWTLSLGCLFGEQVCAVIQTVWSWVLTALVSAETGIEPYERRTTLACEKPGLSRLDTAFFALCLLLAMIFFIGYWRNLPAFVFLGSDAANISGFVAGRAHPDLFGRDPLLGNPSNYQVYLTAHLPLIQWLGTLLGDYGQPWAYLFAPLYLIQLLGFYWFGKELFRHRGWAMLLSLTCSAFTVMNLGEFWGIGYDAIPRIAFQSLLPYVLSAAVRWRGIPRRWWWVMAMAGALVYVHPVSTPAWGFAIWLGFLPFLPQEWRLSRCMAWMLLNGLVFLAVLAPYAVYYTNSFAHGSVGDYDMVAEAILYRFAPGFLDPAQGAVEFFKIMATLYLPLTCLTIAGMLLAPLAPIERKDRREALSPLLWLAGILLVSIPLPILDHGLAAARSALPFEFDLIRGLRYVFPLAILIGLLGLQALTRASRSRVFPFPALTSFLLLAAGLGFSLFWLVRFPVEPLRSAVGCWQSGHFFCPLGEQERLQLDALDIIRDKTEAGSTILPTDLALEIRYYALRAVVYSYKDGGILGYTNPDALLTWYANTLNFKEIMEIEPAGDRLGRLADLAIELNADYLFVGWKVTPEELAGVPVFLVDQNEIFTLLRLTVEMR